MYVPGGNSVQERGRETHKEASAIKQKQAEVHNYASIMRNTHRREMGRNALIITPGGPTGLDGVCLPLRCKAEHLRPALPPCSIFPAAFFSFC